MTASVRSVNLDNVKRLVEAVRIGDGFDMDKILRAASDIGGYAPETDPRYEPDCRKGVLVHIGWPRSPHRRRALRVLSLRQSCLHQNRYAALDPKQKAPSATPCSAGKSRERRCG